MTGCEIPSSVSMLFQQHQYADDTQLFLTLSPTGFSSDISNLTQCLSTLHYWFCQNGMALNPDKSDAIIIGTHQRSSSYSNITSIDVAGSAIPLSDHIKVLGVTLDKHLTFDDYVSAVCKSAYYHIRAMRHIRPAISEDMAKSVACALVGARLDYANSVLFGVTSKKRHPSSTCAERRGSGSRLGSNRRSTNSSNILEQLHWLPIEWRGASSSRSPASPTKLCPLSSLLISTQYWNIMFHLVLDALLAPIYYSSPVSVVKFRVMWSKMFD